MLKMAVEVMMLAAAPGFGALAFCHWRAQGKPVLRKRGLVLALRGRRGHGIAAWLVCARYHEPHERKGGRKT